MITTKTKKKLFKLNKQHKRKRSHKHSQLKSNKREKEKEKLTGHEIGESNDAYDEDDNTFLGFLSEVSHCHLVRLRHAHLEFLRKIHATIRNNNNSNEQQQSVIQIK